MTLPELLPVEGIRSRLLAIFPEGTPHRQHIVKPHTAKLVFCALFVGAIEGTDRWFAPRHLYRMTDDLALTKDEALRLAFYKQPPGSSPESWYADNSREGARDEGVRQGLIPLNAVLKRPGIATTSSKGRYALHPAFAALFAPSLDGAFLIETIAAWQARFLTGAALARAALAATMDTEAVTVFHPQGGSTVLPPGESPLITKAVVEDFSRHFLAKPAVVWISDSAAKRFSDDRLGKVLGINLDIATLLPDVVLVDTDGSDLKLVFVEVVATDGPMTTQRREAIMDLVTASPRGYAAQDAFFVTAYRDRAARPVARALAELAWGSFAWFVSEPEYLVQLHDGRPRRLREL